MPHNPDCKIATAGAFAIDVAQSARPGCCAGRNDQVALRKSSKRRHRSCHVGHGNAGH